MKLKSIRVRITVLGIVTLALVIGVGALITIWAIDNELTQDIRNRNFNLLDAMAEDIESGADPTRIVLPRATDWAEITIVNGEGIVINSTNTETLGSDDAFANQADLADARGGQGIVREATTPEGEVITLLAEAPVGLVGNGLGNYESVITLLVPVLVALGGAALWVAVGAALRRVKQMTIEANSIAPTTSGERLRVPDSSDEIALLALTLNSMIDRLDAGLIRQREFVSDASHELRSPLTAIKGASELIASSGEVSPEVTPVIATLQRGAHRLERVLDDLTQLAEGGIALTPNDLDLDVVVLDEVAAVRLDYPAVEFHTGGVAPVVVHAHEAQLGRAVQNLVSNAARHAASLVAVSAGAADGVVTITVDDDGPGVAVTDRKRVFDRFVRLDEHRSRAGGGSGLGLAIVASIAAAHNGRVTCTDGPLGGARFVMEFPIQDGQNPAVPLI